MKDFGDFLFLLVVKKKSKKIMKIARETEKDGVNF